ncbi:MAG TPA: hypothetical protein VGM84_15720 [Steroidobacteraceae bacterium]|jgi:RNA polymerase sigma-70 factor (ECF subfamily)
MSQTKSSPVPGPSVIGTPLERAVAAELISDMDLLRLKANAKLLARGLAPEVQWWDLLQEAFARVLSGHRGRPPGVPVDAFITGVMRSIRSQYWRQMSRGCHESETDIFDPSPDPERALLAVQELAAITRLFADDPVVMRILDGLADGLTPDEICSANGFSKTTYDSARKRMRRTLLREGLRMEFRP